MIRFSSSDCGKIYTVDDQFSGRKTRCRACGAGLVVPVKILLNPSASPAIPPPLPSARVAALAPRTRHLLADAEQMRRAFQGFPLIQVRSITGNPPDLYQIEFRVQSLARGAGGVPQSRHQHLVEIQLTRDYPRQSPKCKMLTPIFHPNFDPTTICVGDHWTASERLVDLVIRIGEMIAFQTYNVKSPLDGEAAMWADLNQRLLPTDRHDLRPPNLE